MPPKKAKTAAAPAGQPTIGAAFARKSGEHATAGAATAGASPVAAAAPPLVLVRQQGGVVEYSDFAVNNIKDEAGSKPYAKAPESDTVDAGACPAYSRLVASAHQLLCTQICLLAALSSRGVLNISSHAPRRVRARAACAR